MRRSVRFALPLLASLSLLGCATEKMRSRQNVLTDTLQAYAGAIRWGEVEQAQDFLDPELRAAHPPTALELARFKQVRVTAYDEHPPVPAGENEVRQTVEIGLVNINSQVARSVIDHQVWHYDETKKRWWLTSGLPDITRQQ